MEGMTGHRRTRDRPPATDVGGAPDPRPSVHEGPAGPLNPAGLLALQRTAGNSATTATVLRQKADQRDASGTSAKAAPHDSIVIWFDRDSDALRKDPGTGQLVADTIA